MKKCCFLIPVHPPHYNFLDFLHKIPEHTDFDIILIISTFVDLNELQSLNLPNISSIIVMQEKVSEDLMNYLLKNHGFITFKKWYGLNEIKNKYEYIAVVDSEIEIVNPINVYDKFKNFCDNKTVIGSTVKESNQNLRIVKEINDVCKVFYENHDLEQFTNNSTFYFWFSDIPIYKSNILNDFLKFINFEDYDEISKKLTWGLFDYIPYIFYCHLFNGYGKIDILDYGIKRNWSLESMPIETYLEVLDKTNYKPNWLIHDVYNENKDILDNIMMTYHRNDGRAVIFPN